MSGDFHNAETLASLLNHRQYREEISPAECNKAKELGLVVVFGASDDLCEFRGAINEEYGAWDGAKFGWSGSEFVENKDDAEIGIEQNWCPEGKDIGWEFITNIPNAHKFLIKEDDEDYGEGLVFSISDLPIDEMEALKQENEKLKELLQKNAEQRI